MAPPRGNLESKIPLQARNLLEQSTMTVYSTPLGETLKNQGVSPDQFNRYLQAVKVNETGLKMNATSWTGVKGLMQVTHKTFNSLYSQNKELFEARGLPRNREHPGSSALAGALYYGDQLAKLKDPTAAAVAYNSGPRAGEFYSQDRVWAVRSEGRDYAVKFDRHMAQLGDPSTNLGAASEEVLRERYAALHERGLIDDKHTLDDPKNASREDLNASVQAGTKALTDKAQNALQGLNEDDNNELQQLLGKVAKGEELSEEEQEKLNTLRSQMMQGQGLDPNDQAVGNVFLAAIAQALGIPLGRLGVQSPSSYARPQPPRSGRSGPYGGQPRRSGGGQSGASQRSGAPSPRYGNYRQQQGEYNKTAREPENYIPPQLQDPITFGQIDSDDQFGFRGNGSFEGVDSRLQEIIRQTAEEFPLRVRVMSGKRGRSSGDHSRGRAVDITLYDQDGNALGNYQNPQNFRAYEAFAQAAYLKARELYPDLTDGRGKDFNWGGHFGDGGRGKYKYGSNDTMDFRIASNSRFRAGTIMGGLNERHGWYDKGDLLGGSRAYSPEALAETMKQLESLRLTPEQRAFNERTMFGVAKASGRLGARGDVDVKINVGPTTVARNTNDLWGKAAALGGRLRQQNAVLSNGAIHIADAGTPTTTIITPAVNEAVKQAGDGLKAAGVAEEERKKKDPGASELADASAALKGSGVRRSSGRKSSSVPKANKSDEQATARA